MNYQCISPVAIIIFNRPDYTERVFEQIRRVRPSKLYIISDGAREGNKSDSELIAQCRGIVSKVDWPCKVTKIFSDSNLGCKKRVITGLNQVFENEENAIILEDDCVPTEMFFEFCDWGLGKYSDNSKIALVSGSNLIDYETDLFEKTSDRAGFSMYINCWGWATWKRTWSKFDSFLSIQEVNGKISRILTKTPLNNFEKRFWRGVFRHSIYARTIWDFYLQYKLFENSWISVFPRYNLVENIGFGSDSTHTHVLPEFVEKSWPKSVLMEKVNQLDEPVNIVVNQKRDHKVISIIYGYSVFSTIKLEIGNILRYLGIR